MLNECASCQEPLTDDAKVCPKCGAVNAFYERRKPAPLALTLAVLGGLALFLVVPRAIGPYLPPGAGPLLEKTLPIAMASGFVLLGTLVLVYELIGISRRRRVIASGNRSIGTVTRTTLHQHASQRENDEGDADVSPVVRFTTDSGDSVEFKAAPKPVFRWGPSYWSEVNQQGQRVDVAYDATHPSSAFVVGRPDPGARTRVMMSVGLIVAGVVWLFRR
jgi:hypothetical protein